MRPRQVLIATAIVLAGCAHDPTSTDKTAGSHTVTLVALTGTGEAAGQVGQAAFVGHHGGTDVTITVSGVPTGFTRPVHLYAYLYEGACGRLATQPEYTLTARVQAEPSAASGGPGGPYTVRNRLAVPLATLQTTPHAVLVKSAPADRDLNLFCGDIR
jgi:hypothetical protein